MKGRRWWWVLWVLGILMLVAGVLFLYQFINPSSPEDHNEFVKTTVQLIGGMVLAGGVYFTWQNLKINQENQRINLENERVNQENHRVNLDNALENQKANRERERLTQEGQITDRYTKAVEQLGSDKLEVRLGGIYALERLSKDSPRESKTVIEVLTAYIRHNASKYSTVVPIPPVDIQAAIAVLKRRTHNYLEGEEYVLNLGQTNLQRGEFTRGHFEAAIFIGTRLDGAVFFGAHLEGSSFMEASAPQARFDGAHLHKAIFIGANLERASFDQANLSEASFEGAKLVGVSFDGTYLKGANLKHADLSGVYNLTAAQLAQSMTDYATVLPTYLQPLTENDQSLQ